MAELIRQLIEGAVLALIRSYQWLISPLLGPHCRFYPSCSQYALEAVQRHGIVRGSWLAVRRLSRCHPWHPGGIDTVPHPSHGEFLSAHRPHRKNEEA